MLHGTIHCRPKGDLESLKTEFEKLCDAQKPTSDPSYPAEVRRLKHIARKIQANVAAKLLEDDNSAGNGSSGNSDEEENEIENRNVGARKKCCPKGKAGVHCKMPKTNDVVVKRSQSMTKSMSIISNYLAAPGSAINDQQMLISKLVKKEDESLKNDLEMSMSDTKQMINGINAPLQILVGELSTVRESKNRR